MRTLIRKQKHDSCFLDLHILGYGSLPVQEEQKFSKQLFDLPKVKKRLHVFTDIFSDQYLGFIERLSFKNWFNFHSSGTG